MAVYASHEHKDNYGLKLVFYMVVIFLSLVLTSFYLIQNYYSNSFLTYDGSSKKIYFLESKTLKNMYKSYSMNYNIYEDNINRFKTLCEKNGFKTDNIYTDNLGDIPKKSIVIGSDLMALSNEENENISKFVQNGGKILFNYTSGFLNEKLHDNNNHLVKRITGMDINKTIKTVKFSKHEEKGFLTPRLLSPITQFLSDGPVMDLNLYDPIPIFNSKKVQPDAYLTNWIQVNMVKITKDKDLGLKQSGLVWHGYYGKGKL